MKRIGKCGHEVIVESLEFPVEEDDHIVMVTWCETCLHREKIMYTKEGEG